MKNLNHFFVAFLLAFFVVSCEKEPTVEILPVSKEYKLINVSYGTNERNVMDVFLPSGRTADTPLAILIHGGAWISGDKSLMTDLQNTLLSEGIASVSINYRYVSPSVHCDELMQDIDRVVQHCIDHAEEWQVRKTNIIIGGHSAGAHLSLMYGYAYDNRKVISGIISAAGPTNLYDETYLQEVRMIFPLAIIPIQQLANAVYTPGQSVPENFRKISPVTRIQQVPTLMVHGTEDELVAYETVVAFETELNKKGVTNKLFTITGADHSFTNISASMSDNMDREMINWINLYGK